MKTKVTPLFASLIRGSLLAGVMILAIPSVSFADRGGRHHYGHDGGYSYNYGHNHNHGHNYNYGNNYGHGYGNNNGHYSGNSYNGGRGSISQLISNGSRSGALTPSELRAINKEDRELREKSWKYRSDGYLSDKERRDLSNEYREFRDEVMEEIRDGERRHGHWW